jgi:hypothetical protein
VGRDPGSAPHRREAEEDPGPPVAGSLLQEGEMRSALLALLALALGACATATETRWSHTPAVEVIVRTPKARTAQANYQVAPGDAASGLGGSAR